MATEADLKELERALASARQTLYRIGDALLSEDSSQLVALIEPVSDAAEHPLFDAPGGLVRPAMGAINWRTAEAARTVATIGYAAVKASGLMRTEPGAKRVVN